MSTPDMSDSRNWHTSAAIGETVTVLPGYTGGNTYNERRHVGDYVVREIMRSEFGHVTDYKLARPYSNAWDIICHVSRIIQKAT